MCHDDNNRFRQGVRQLKCAGSTTLAEAVTAQLALERDGSELNSLDLIEMGSVYVNDERCLNPARTLKAGDQFRVHTAPRRFAAPNDLAARILAESEESFLVEKPAGLPADAQVDNLKENLIAFLEELRGQSLFLTHRQATDSDGLMLIAKTPAAQARIKQAFAEGCVRRKYLAYTQTVPSDLGIAPFRISHAEERISPTILISENRINWQILGTPLAALYRLEVEFKQARPKEIREALAKMGAPIIGDIALGSKIELRDSVSQKPAIAFRAIALEIFNDGDQF